MNSHIILGPDGNVKTVEEISTEQLKTMVVRAQDINKYYADIGKENWIWRNTNPKNLPNEQWRDYPGNKKFLVSNLGRVKVGDKIAVQVEESGKDFAGYLIVQGEPKLPYVYRLVAETWLAQLKDFRAGWEVHHITNDGYDNRPENLIWLPPAEHRKISHRGRKQVYTPRYKHS